MEVAQLGDIRDVDPDAARARGRGHLPIHLAIVRRGEHELVAVDVSVGEGARDEATRPLGGQPRDGLDRSGRNHRHPRTLG